MFKGLQNRAIMAGEEKILEGLRDQFMVEAALALVAEDEQKPRAERKWRHQPLAELMQMRDEAAQAHFQKYESTFKRAERDPSQLARIPLQGLNLLGNRRLVERMFETLDRQAVMNKGLELILAQPDAMLTPRMVQIFLGLPLVQTDMEGKPSRELKLELWLDYRYSRIRAKPNAPSADGSDVMSRLFTMQRGTETVETPMGEKNISLSSSLALLPAVIKNPAFVKAEEKYQDTKSIDKYIEATMVEIMQAGGGKLDGDYNAAPYLADAEGATLTLMHIALIEAYTTQQELAHFAAQYDQDPSLPIPFVNSYEAANAFVTLAQTKAPELFAPEAQTARIAALVQQQQEAYTEAKTQHDKMLTEKGEELKKAGHKIEDLQFPAFDPAAAQQQAETMALPLTVFAAVFGNEEMAQWYLSNTAALPHSTSHLQLLAHLEPVLLNAQDSEGRTPAVLAAYMAATPLLDSLHELGADFSIKDNAGNDVLAAAALCGAEYAASLATRFAPKPAEAQAAAAEATAPETNTAEPTAPTAPPTAAGQASAGPAP